jgi:hypothetical protein
LPHGLGYGGGQNSILLEQSEDVGVVLRGAEPVRRYDVGRDLDASFNGGLQRVEHCVLALPVRAKVSSGFGVGERASLIAG